MKEQLETFDERLNKRMQLWRSIVLDSGFSDKVKDQFLFVIQERFGKGKPAHETTNDWIYFSINRILNLVDKVSKEEMLPREEFMPLFENLRDDLWDFYGEINK